MWYFIVRVHVILLTSFVKICKLSAVPIRCRIFDFWERERGVRARKGGLSKDNVLSSDERCWKCSLLNSLSTHIKTKCLYMRCYGYHSLATIFIFSILSRFYASLQCTRSTRVQCVNYTFPVIYKFNEIWVYSIFKFCAMSIPRILRQLFGTYTYNCNYE